MRVLDLSFEPPNTNSFAILEYYHNVTLCFVAVPNCFSFASFQGLLRVLEWYSSLAEALRNLTCDF